MINGTVLAFMHVMYKIKKLYHESSKVRKHEKDKHQFEELSRKIIGAAIEVHRELKAVKEFADIHFAQLRSYLKATGLKVGLLLNFARPTLDIKRVVF